MELEVEPNVCFKSRIGVKKNITELNNGFGNQFRLLKFFA